jgi:hypothetical protein
MVVILRPLPEYRSSALGIIASLLPLSADACAMQLCK